MNEQTINCPAYKVTLVEIQTGRTVQENYLGGKLQFVREWVLCEYGAQVLRTEQVTDNGGLCYTVPWVHSTALGIFVNQIEFIFDMPKSDEVMA